MPFVFALSVLAEVCLIIGQAVSGVTLYKFEFMVSCFTVFAIYARGLENHQERRHGYIAIVCFYVFLKVFFILGQVETISLFTVFHEVYFVVAASYWVPHLYQVWKNTPKTPWWDGQLPPDDVWI